MSSGFHNQQVFCHEQDNKNATASSLGEAVKPHYNAIKRGEKTATKLELVTWLKLFASRVGDKMRDKPDVTVFTYHHANANYEEYTADDLRSANGTLGEPLKKSRFYVVFNAVCVKDKNRLLRSTGTHVHCTVCDTYHTRMRKVRSLHEREQPIGHAIPKMRAHWNRE